MLEANKTMMTIMQSLFHQRYRRSAMALAAVSSQLLTGCGGGDSTTSVIEASVGSPASLASPRVGARLRGLAVRASDSTSAALDTLVVRAYLTNPSFSPIAALAAEAIADLDVAGIRFQIVECGIYTPGPSGTTPGNGADFPPAGLVFRISAQDLNKAAAAGMEPYVLDPALEYHFADSRVCDLDTTLSAYNRIFEIAPRLYPELFPLGSLKGQYEGYWFADFVGSGNYLGVKDGRVYLHNGREWNFLDVGAVTDYIPTLE
jgi:hypothetical protein